MNIRYFLEGFLLGLAYVAPIGMQNMYVINTAVRSKRLRAFQVALITSFFDISLALACFFGIGLVLSGLPVLKNIVLAIGCIAVVYIGISLIRSKPDISDNRNTDEPLLKVAAICFAVTWINPQAIIDGTLLLGGFRAALPAAYSNIFILGSAAASLSWFIILTAVVSIFRSMIGPRALRVINIICGSTIILYGLRLGWSLIGK